MLALKHGERALPLAWRVEATEGPIGFGGNRGRSPGEVVALRAMA